MKKGPTLILLTQRTENRSILYALVPDHRRPEESIKEKEGNTVMHRFL